MTREEKIKRDKIEALLSGDIVSIMAAVGIKLPEQPHYYVIVGNAVIPSDDGDEPEYNYDGAVWDKNGVKLRFGDIVEKLEKKKLYPVLYFHAKSSEEEILKDVAIKKEYNRLQKEEGEEKAWEYYLSQYPESFTRPS